MRASVGVKLLGGFGLIFALMVVIGAVALYNLAVVNDLTARLYAKELLGVQEIGLAQTALDGYRLATVETLVASDAAERDRQTARRRDAETVFRQRLVSIQGYVYTQEGRALYAQVDAAWSQYQPQSDQVMAAIAAGSPAEATRISQTTARQREEAVGTALRQLTDWKGALAAGKPSSRSRPIRVSGISPWDSCSRRYSWVSVLPCGSPGVSAGASELRPKQLSSSPPATSPNA